MPPSRSRGRPRGFDVDAVLDRAVDTFWTRGFAATSLDDLCEAMGIARPSLYAAFGDKEALYLASVARFRGRMAELYIQAVRSKPTGRDGILAFFREAIARYTSGEVSRGCLGVCTAAVEAPSHPAVRTALAHLLKELDDAFAGTLRRARDRGELASDADIAALAALLSATLHSIAVRARAGTGKAELQRLARSSVDVILGAPP
jgi:TetR/AcrR family transcriptional regulator, copper-responsive repressor